MNLHEQVAMRILSFLIILLWLHVPVVHAQGVSVPTAQECRVAANKLGSDPHSAAYRWALTEGRLAKCGAIGAAVLAQVLGQADALTDTIALGGLEFSASTNRSPVIFRAALATAGAKTAGVQARELSLRVLLRQYNIEVALPASAYSARPSAACISHLVLHAAYNSSEPLQPDSRQRIIELSDRIAGDEDEPQVLRNLARCLNYTIKHINPWSPGMDEIWIDEPSSSP